MPQEPVGEDGHNGQCHEQAREQGDGRGQGEGAEHLAGLAGDEGQRQEHGNGRQGRCGDGAGDFGDGGKDVRELLTARGVPSSDGFDDDDRVVDDASDRDRQRTQGQHVQGLPAHPQTDHGDEQRQRDRDRCDDGGADREQEHEDDEDREEQSQSAFDEQIVDRLFDEWCLIEGGDELGVVPHRLLEFGQLLGHGSGDVDGVGVGFLHDRHRQRGLAVGARNRFDGLVLDLDVGDVGELDRVVLAADDEILDGIDGADAGSDLDRCRALIALQLARRGGDAVGLENAGDLVEVGSLVFEVVTTDRDLDLFGLRTGDHDLRDAVDLLQLGFGDVLEVGGELVLIGVRGHGQREDGNVIGSGRIHGGFDTLGQRGLDLRNRALEGLDDVVGVLAVLGAHGDRGTARRGRRSHVLDLWQRRQRTFQGVGDLLFDGLRGCALVRGGDRGLGVFEGGEELLFESSRPDDAEDDGDDGNERNERTISQTQTGQKTHVVTL